MSKLKFVCAPKTKIISAAFMSKDDEEALDSVKATRFVEMLNALMNKVIAEMYNSDKSKDTLLSFKDGRRVAVAYSNLQRKLVNADFIKDLSPEMQANLAVVLEDWNRFIKYYAKYNPHIKTSDEFTYEFSDAEQTDENVYADPTVEDVSDPKEDVKDIFDQPGNSYEEFELSSGELQLLFRYLPKMKFNAETYEFTYDLAEDGMPQQADYLNIMKLIINKTKGIRDQGAFLNIITSKELYNVIPEMQALDDVLKFSDIDNMNAKQRKLFNSFYTVFSRPYNPVHSSQKIISDTENVHKMFKNTKGNKDKIEAAFRISFQARNVPAKYNEFVQIDNSVKEDEGRNNASDYGYGKKRLVSVPGMDDVNKRFISIPKSAAEIDRITLDKIKKEYKEHLDFISMLGIELSGIDLIDTNPEKATLISLLNKAAVMRDKLQERLKAGQFMFNPIEDVKTEYNYFEGKERKTSKIYTYFTDDLIEFESMFSKLAPTIISKNAEGQNQSDITLANAFTIAFDTITQAKSEDDILNSSYYLDIDKRNPQYKNSFIRKNVLNFTPESMKIYTGNYSGYELRSEKNSFKRSTKNLLAKHKFINDFSNMILYGQINTPQLERKSSYYFFQFLKGEVGSMPFDRATFTTGFTNSTDWFQQILHYIQGEVERVRTYPDGLNDFNQFKFMEKSLTPLLTIPKSELSLLENWKTPLAQSLKGDVDAYFESRLVAWKKFITRNRIDIDELVPDKLIASYLSNPEFSYIPKAELKKEVLDGLLRAYIANTYIINTEFTIFVSGNPIFYKKDAHKRFGGIASTGIRPTVEPFLNDIFKYDKDEKFFWNNYSLRGIMNGIEGIKAEDRRQNDKDYQTAVIKEDVSKSNGYTSNATIEGYIKSVAINQKREITKEQASKELLLKNIIEDGIKIGDGQGYMNLDFHREMSIRQDFWRPEHDISYQFESLVFKKNIMKQKLSDDENTKYNKLMAQILDEPNKYALPILKETYYGTIANKDMKVDGKAFDKFSLFPLLPTVAFGNPKMEQLLKTMAERQLGYVKYQSATKGFVRQVLTLDTLASNKELDLYRTDLLKLQLLPFSEEKTEVSLLTQKIKLLFANLFDSGVPVTPKVKELRNEFIKILSEIQELNKDHTRSGLGIRGEEWNLQVMVDMIAEQVKAQKLSRTTLEGMKLDPETGEFEYPLEMSGIYRQVMDSITGYIDRNARKFKVNGTDFTLVSPSMFKRAPKHYVYGDDGVVHAECFITLTKEHAKLLELPDNKDDYTIPKNLKGEVEEYEIYTTEKIGTIERLNQLINSDVFYEKHKEALTVTFSRAPIDAQHSMGVGRVTKFFYPTAGNIMVLPEEYLHQAGIDFDIDKERGLFPHIDKEGYVVKKGGTKARLSKLEEEYQGLREVWDMVDDYTKDTESWEDEDTYQGYIRLKKDRESIQEHLLGSDVLSRIISKVFSTDLLSIEGKMQELEEKAIEYIGLKNREREELFNRLLNVINNTLTLPESFSELILPSNTERVRTLARENANDLATVEDFVQAELPKQDKVYDTLENLNVFKTYNDAASLLGAYALDNTINEVLAQHNLKIPQKYGYNERGVATRYINLLGLTEDQKAKIVIDGKIGFTRRTNIDGEFKQHLRSELISATVDAAKDPFFADLGISFDNINSELFLISIGYPDDVSHDLINTAPIRKLVQLKQEGQSLIQAFNSILREYGMKGDDVFKPAIIGLDSGVVISQFKPLITSESNLVWGTKGYKVMDPLRPATKVEMSDAIKLMAWFIATEDHASSLGKFKNLFKNDTTKTSSLFEVLAREQNRRDVIDRGMFTEEDIELVENDSTIAPYRNDQLIKDIIQPISPILSQPDVVSTLSSIFARRKTENLINSAILANIMTADFLTFNVMQFGLYTDGNGVVHKFYDYARRLVVKEKVGEEFNKVLLDRIITLKGFPAYNKILATFPVIGNIQGDITKKIGRNLIYDGNEAYNVQFNVSPNLDMLQKESYQLQFKRIVEGDFDFGDERVNKALQNFVKDFFIAGILQSGFNKSARSYYEYAPLEFIQSILQPSLDIFQNLSRNNRNVTLTNFEEEFIKNNSQYFPKEVIDDDQAQQNTYLGKYYANENTVKEIQRMAKKKNPPSQEGNLFGLDTEDQAKMEFHINTLSVVTDFLNAVGVKQQLIPSFLREDGTVIEGALAAANFIKGTVDIIEDAEKRPSAWNKLPEEAAHWWYRLLKEDSVMKKALWDLARESTKLKELVDGVYGEYYEIEDLNSDLIDVLTEEAIGQIIAESIKKIEEKSGSPKDYSFFEKFLEWIKSIIDIFKSVQHDPFEVAAMKILSNDISDLMSFKEYNKVYNHVYFTEETTARSTYPVDYVILNDIGRVSDNNQFYVGDDLYEIDVSGYDGESPDYTPMKNGEEIDIQDYFEASTTNPKFHFIFSRGYQDKYGKKSPMFDTQEELDFWIQTHIPEHDKRQKALADEVRDNEKFYERLMSKTFKRKTKFLPKTLKKFYRISESYNVRRLEEFSPHIAAANNAKLVKKLSDHEKQLLVQTNNYTNIRPTLKVLPDILAKYGFKSSKEAIQDKLALTQKRLAKEITKEEYAIAEEKINRKHSKPISLSEPFKIDGAKKQELNILNGIKDLIRTENPTVKTITAEEFVNEVHHWLETNYLLGFADEQSYLSYRVDQTFTEVPDRVTNEDFNLNNMTEEQIMALPVHERQRIATMMGLTKQNPSVYHNKVSIRFNDNYHTSGHSHFSLAPSAWGNLTYFYTGKHQYKDAVLLHEIQNDNIERLRNFKGQETDMDALFEMYQNRLNNDLDTSLLTLRSNSREAFIDIDDMSIQSEPKMLVANQTLGHWFASNHAEYDVNPVTSYRNFKNVLRETVELHKASGAVGDAEAAKEKVENAYSRRRIIQDFIRRGGIKSILTKEDMETLSTSILAANMAWAPGGNEYLEDENQWEPIEPRPTNIGEKKQKFAERADVVRKKINAKITELYGRKDVFIGKLEIAAKPLPKSRRLNRVTVRDGVTIRTGNAANELNDSIKFLITTNEKAMLAEANNDILITKKDYMHARNATARANYSSKLLKLSQEQYNGIMLNYKHNLNLLKTSVNERAQNELAIPSEASAMKKLVGYLNLTKTIVSNMKFNLSSDNRILATQHNDGDPFAANDFWPEQEFKEFIEEHAPELLTIDVAAKTQEFQTKEHERLMTLAKQKYDSYKENKEAVIGEVNNLLETELNYFTPLVHHLIQKHINQYGKDFPMYFAGYGITMLTQGNENTAMIYAGKDEIHLVDKYSFEYNGKGYSRGNPNSEINPDNVFFQEYSLDENTPLVKSLRNLTEAEYDKIHQAATREKADMMKFTVAVKLGLVTEDQGMEAALKALAAYKKESPNNSSRVNSYMLSANSYKPWDTGALYNAMSQISGVKLIWQPHIEGIQGKPGGYLVDLTNYNYNVPVLYGMQKVKPTPSPITTVEVEGKPSLDVEQKDRC